MASTGKKTSLVTQTTLTAQATLPQSELQADSGLSLSRASLTNYHGAVQNSFLVPLHLYQLVYSYYTFQPLPVEEKQTGVCDRVSE